jgi:hypothetical protein
VKVRNVCVRGMVNRGNSERYANISEFKLHVRKTVVHYCFTKHKLN